MRTLPASRLASRIAKGSHTLNVRQAIGLVNSASTVWCWPDKTGATIRIAKTQAREALRHLRKQGVRRVNVFVGDYGCLAIL